MSFTDVAFFIERKLRLALLNESDRLIHKKNMMNRAFYYFYSYYYPRGNQ